MKGLHLCGPFFYYGRIMKTETVEITALAYGGDGIGHLGDGRVAFVSGAFPGDVVRAAVDTEKERFVRGHVAELLEPCQQRVEPPCKLAASGVCGGCPWAGLAYETQLHWKRQALVDALVRITKLDPEKVQELVGECRPSKKQWNYRNKVEFEAGIDVAGRFTLGMHAQGGSFSPLASCQLINKKFEKAPRALTGALRYAAGRNDLGIERVGLRYSERTGSVEVALWGSPGRFPRANAAKVLSDALPAKQVGVTRVLLKGAAKARKVSGTEVLNGRGFWTEQLNGYSMALSAPSFFQVNTRGAETLVELALSALDVDGLDSVLDLYSGAGTFTLPLAQRAHSVLAVEMAGSSVRDLRRNLDHNGLFAEVVGGDVGRELKELGQVDKVVVDPPRSGLGAEAIAGLLSCAPRVIAYVSCNPTTLARDVKELLAVGYELAGATPVDLFPQSYHVETVAILTRERGRR